MAGPTLAPAATPLRDIHGIDGVPWWPPAPGWWVLAAALLLLALALRYRRPRGRRSWRLPVPTIGSWRHAAARELRALRRRAAGQSTKETAGELSELLRRIAMARIGRTACAGLTGQDWLDWLAANDPNGFDWARQGRLLLVAPYAPPASSAGDAATLATLTSLIDAATAWAEARPARRPTRNTGGNTGGNTGEGAAHV
ncbi:hypothetical protein Thimo_1116 [Thioflavicoccus mobilis 8321]|uniref:DUF4381 domain-containing protein n=1 Tax=Thioflavicoccus mobilis 8321 TaxID=765912 RepID=L0GX85_9GAMM|nr:DUF4381 domain-containing protein [Thioflavicoccus mobilis]AGA89919.1 hypothetical protein Thimo_1116 [Thioflavicoccus mobilis 8321]